MKKPNLPGVWSLVLAATASFAGAQTSGRLNTQYDDSWSTAAWLISSGTGFYPDAGGVATFLPQINSRIGESLGRTGIFLNAPVTLSGIDFRGPFGWRVGPGNQLTMSPAGATVSAEVPDFDSPLYQITSPITGGGTAGLIKTGPGSLTLSATNSYTGGTHINAGAVEVTNGDGALGATGAGNDISLNGGGALRISGTPSFTTSRGVSVGSGGGVLEALVSGNAAFNGVVSGPGDLFLAGTGGYAFSAANTFSGALHFTGKNSSLTLAGAGGAFRLASVYNIVAPGGVTLLDNSGANHDDRLNDTAPIKTGAYTLLALTGNSVLSTRETAGPLTVAGTTRLSANADTGQQTIFHFASINREDHGTLFISGTNLGAHAGPFVAQITSAAAPALLGGGGAAGSTNMSIVPWATGKNSTAGGQNGSTHVTCASASSAWRPLGTHEYAASFGGNPADNVRLTTDHAAPANTTVNSLLFAPASPATLSGGPINVTSGSFLYSPTSFIFPAASTVNAGLNFGAAEGIIYATNNVNISGAITGANGLTIVPRGFTVSLHGANTYTGPTHIFEGVVEVRGDIPDDGMTPNPLGLSTSPIVLHPGAILKMTPGPARDDADNIRNKRGLLVAAALSIFIELPGLYGDRVFVEMDSSGKIVYEGPWELQGTLEAHGSRAAANTPSVNGIVSGRGSLKVFGFIDLNGSNAHTGGTTVNPEANVGIGSNNAFGHGPVTFESGAGEATMRAIGADRTITNDLRLLNPAIFAGDHDLTVTGRVSLASGAGVNVEGSGASVQFTGGMVGYVIKTGRGNLDMNVPAGDRFDGLEVREGACTLTHAAAGSVPGGTVSTHPDTILNVAGTCPGPARIQGIMEAGNSVGTADFASSLELAGAAQVRMELGGPSSADSINVAGLLTLNGTVKVVTADGYTAQLGDTFDLLDWGALDAANFEPGDLDFGGAGTAPGIAWDRSEFLTSGTIKTGIDTDGDRLTDDDETNLFSTDPAHADIDGDGMNDEAEIRAGTDPGDPASSLRITHVERTGPTRMAVTWTAKDRRHYRLVRSTDLNFTSPTVVAANLPGHEPTATYIDTTVPGTGTKLFYRVEVQ